ncbi:MAG: LOG family protein [Anaerolineales bacterium]|nr:MAG: LOG family protein [Anaerolineales bacterium]
MNITIFGSASPQPGQPAYEEARRLGQLLAGAGHTVLTGGYMGTMEAASRGAAEAGGHVVGVTCQQIEDWRAARHNPWVLEERKFPTLRERLYCLIDSCDAALALPGGIGTLDEIVTMWSQMQTSAMPTRPLILIGDGWRRTMLALIEAQDEHIRPAHRELLSYAEDIDHAVSLLAEALAA